MVSTGKPAKATTTIQPPEPEPEPAPAPAPVPAPVPTPAPAPVPAPAPIPVPSPAPSKLVKAPKSAKAAGKTDRAETAHEPVHEPEQTTSGEDALTAIRKAEAAFSDNHMATARIAATQAVAASRNASASLKARAHIIMGKVELASEQFGRAEEAFTRALALDPQNALARKGLQRAQESAAKEKR